MFWTHGLKLPIHDIKQTLIFDATSALYGGSCTKFVNEQHERLYISINTKQKSKLFNSVRKF